MAKRLNVKIFIDGANMFYTQKKLGWLFDWEKVKNYLQTNYSVLELRFYGSFKRGKKRDRQFLNALERIGFKIISKPLKLIEDELTGKIVPKANFDVEITRDIFLDLLWFKNNWRGAVFLWKC